MKIIAYIYAAAGANHPIGYRIEIESSQSREKIILSNMFSTTDYSPADAIKTMSDRLSAFALEFKEKGYNVFPDFKVGECIRG